MDAAVLADEFTLSLSQLRSPVERLISAFLFESHSHSPPCARQGSTVRERFQDAVFAIAPPHDPATAEEHLRVGGMVTLAPCSRQKPSVA